ncbi:hemicentin-1 isoform X11 [Carassius gibelio]|uniref:hemicentin-1 isoform X11 n=1 Tax=Carassius gibelio TaxID=101364 RepID=UPI0022799EDA|nr:hemicentin-1 isoform X11 [Carassius gibelio]
MACFTMLLLQLLISLLLISLSHGDHCPLQLDPQRAVVRYGGSVEVTCNTSVAHKGMGWEASEGGVPMTKKQNLITWRVSELTEWDIKPFCYINPNKGAQCLIELPVTVYKTPDSVSISTVNHRGPMIEGQQYELQCDVHDVAPVQYLTVKWYKNQTRLNQTTFSDTDKTPENKTVTLLIRPDRDDNRAQYWCEAELDLGAEGPQPSPKYSSKPLSITVYYAPIIQFCRDWSPLTGTSLDSYPLNLYSVEGNPHPDISWRHKSSPVRSSMPLTRYDSGLYEIIARNDLNNVSCFMNIIVEYPPELNCNKSYEVKEKTPFKLPCKADGLPKPEYFLYKNGKIIQHDFYPNWNDSGLYQLTAHNQHGTSNSTFTIKILHAPIIQFCRDWSPLTGTSLDSYPLNLYSVEGNPHPDISWRHKSSPVSSSMLLTRYDSGLYEIIARNDLNNVSCFMNIIVKYPPELNCNKSYEVKEKTLFKLPCIADGLPKPEYFLYKNGKIIQHDFYPNWNDSGLYQLTAHNQHGTSNSTFTIKILHAPIIQFCRDWSPLTGTSLDSYPLNLYSVEGNPRPDISWRHKSSPVRSSMPLTRYDSGLYEIIARNDLNNVSCFMNITVEYPPELNCNKSYEVKEKTPFKLPCLADGLPKPEHFLYKNGKIIQHDFYPNWNDSGLYQLTAHNQHGTSNSTFTIKILHAPIIQFCRDWSPLTGTSLDSYPLNLYSVEGNPRPDISWRHKSSPVRSSMPLTRHDSGLYEIIARNDLNNVSCFMNITVEHPPELNCNKSYEVKEKTPFKLPCLADGLPKPEYFLYKNGKIIQHDFYPNWNDSGLYQLTAHNQHGTSNSTFTIKILHAPIIQFCRDWSPLTGTSLDSYPLNLYSVEGNPRPDISWRHKSSPVRSSMPLTRHDSGLYEIIARNDLNNVSCFMNITVEHPPELNCNKSYEVKEKTPFKLPCLADGLPKPEYFLYKNGKIIQHDFYPNWNDSGLYQLTAHNQHGTSNSTFTIKILHAPIIQFCRDWSPLTGTSLDSYPLNVYSVEGNPHPDISWRHKSSPVRSSMLLTRYDSGLYEIIARNDLNNVSCFMNITVEYPPELNCNKSYEVRNKTLFKLPCIVDGLPKPEYFLYKNGKIIQHDFYPNWNDSGLYQLTAHNQHGTSNSTFTIKILHAPVFYDSQEKFVMEEGSNITLECNTTGNPEPEVWWSFKNRNISTGGRHFNIERATSTSAGVYTCSATNKFGRNDKTFIVEIKALDYVFPNYILIVVVVFALLAVIIILVVVIWRRRKSSGHYEIGLRSEMQPLSNGSL